jgi:hypothetical protein
MATPLAADASSVGRIDKFFGNFTQARYLRSQSSTELELRIGYAPTRLAMGWWLLFALEKPAPADFQFGGYTHFSGARIGHPDEGDARQTVEDSLREMLGGEKALMAQRAASLASLQIEGPERLAKVLPVASGKGWPPGTGIYQCNILEPGVRCVVAAFVPPGDTYTGMYT